jgi:23S rRNA (cytosine1962-C5)-methyltransferase
MTKIVLKSGKDESVRRYHPWVFSGAIKKIYGEVKEGDVVDVYDNHDEYLGTGHYGTGSIAVRLLSYEQGASIQDILRKNIVHAFEYRKRTGYIDRKDCNAYRLVFAEGDLCPGLVIDWYNGAAVIQAHSLGMYQSRETIADILKEIYGAELKTIYDKSVEVLFKKSEKTFQNQCMLGDATDTEMTEHDCKYRVNWAEGQKTGFFLDQAENRQLLMQYAAGKKVLNTFSYSGSFSVAALKAGAQMVHSVDSSARAIDLCKANLELNGYDAEVNACFCEDTNHYLERMKEVYDIVVLDPPAYAKHMDARHHAVQGYKRLNTEALRKIGPGGLLFTFSCSQVVDRRMFNSTVVSAAIVAGRNVRILRQLSQPPDHPINAFHPEGEYLKGLVVYVE